MDFGVSVGHRMKVTASGTINKYFDLTRGLKKLWNMKVTVIPVLIRAFRTVTQNQKMAWETVVP